MKDDHQQLPRLPDPNRPPGMGEVIDLTANDKDATARIIAKWLDELIRIPGTNFRIGLEPIMAFFPGVGEVLASSVSLVTVVESVRQGVSPSIVARMGLNMGFNALLGIIPGIGPALSAFFKSNTRNLMLLRRWQEGEGNQLRKGSRWVLSLVVGAVFVVFAALMMLWALYWWSIFQIVKGWFGF
ncbi:MAG: DUF4112 domain-containing protein [Verrucomicrobiaceae bacterium]|nr:DUF4112 domain-containing protein [Verrucomicrobiaceae bacterium]